MPTIKIEVKDNIATNLTPEIEIVSNNGDYEIEFSFDSLWDSYSVKTARFYYNFSHTDIVFDGNVCKVPLLEETQLLKVGVFTDTNKTTTDAEIKCRFSIKKYGGSVHEPTKDVYGQIIDLLNKYIEQGGGGGISREEVERIINEYLTENPPKDGVDGFSPTITTTAIENGTRVTIADINDTKYFDILNGKDGTQVDLSEYQKSTDESLNTTNKTIVGAINEVKDDIPFTNTYSGVGLQINNAKTLQISSAVNTDINAKSSNYKPIVPKNLDYAIKVGLTTNNITLTDEEKASALSWLGVTDLIEKLKSDNNLS